MEERKTENYSECYSVNANENNNLLVYDIPNMKKFLIIGILGVVLSLANIILQISWQQNNIIAYFILILLMLLSIILIFIFFNIKVTVDNSTGTIIYRNFFYKTKRYSFDEISSYLYAQSSESMVLIIYNGNKKLLKIENSNKNLMILVNEFEKRQIFRK